ncbi:MAG: hypothetical protein KR126chlam3_01405, partial [Chlamydiae bacterium]|nr:hypothetical protein [Chlamydiota bacterium]
SVTSLRNGTFVVTWDSDGQDGSNYGIFGRLFAEDGRKIGIEFQVNTYTNNEQSWPSVTRLSNANFVVSWQSYGQDGSVSGIFGQIFNDFLLSSTISSSTTTSSSTSSSISSSTTSITTTTASSRPSSISSSATSITTTTASSRSSNLPSRTTSDRISALRSMIETISQPRTSVISSQSSSKVGSRTIQSSIIDTTNTRRITSHSNPKNRIIWLLLGGGGIAFCSCIGIVGYLIKKRFSQKEKDSSNDQDLSTFTSSPNRLRNTVVIYPPSVTDDEEETQHYMQTPDSVTAGPEPVYLRTPDSVTANPEPVYLRTPDPVTSNR